MVAMFSAPETLQQGGRVQSYCFKTMAQASKGTIILVQGWMSRARYMLSFVDALNDAEFDVVCFDLPAHGKSSGRSTNVRQCADALKAVAAQYQTVKALVAHSFGGAVTASVISESTPHAAALRVGKIVLIAAPNELQDVARNFGAAIGLKEAAQLGFENRLAAQSGHPIAKLNGSRLLSDPAIPLMVLHSENDREVPFAQALKYRALPHCEFVPLQSLGHRRILYSPAVVQTVARFLAR